MTIIDTSALLALYVPGRLSDFVRREIGRIKEGRGECYVLDLVFYEFTNAVRKLVVRGLLSEEEGRRVVSAGLSFIEQCKVVNGRGLAMEAYELSLRYSLTTYDASLIALARRLNDVVLTTDERLLRSVRDNLEISRYFVFPDTTSA